MATPPDYAARERAILDALSAHLAVIDQTGKILTTNAAWRQFAGESGDRGFSHPPVGQNYLASCRKSGEPSALAALAGVESVLQGKLPIFNLEFACHSPHEPRWFRMSVTPLGGESSGAVIAQEAIAPRLALDGSAAGQPVVFGSDADSIWLVSVEDGEVFRFESVNDTFLQVTGFTREQVLHRRMEEWFPPGSLELVQTKYREVVTSGRPLRYEETTDLAAGRRVEEISLTPILDAAGRCTMLLGTAHDITARRQAEDALRASEERYALAVAGTQEGLWDWDLTKDVVFYAPRFKELLGYAPDDHRFPDTIASFRSHLHPEDVGPTEEAIRRTVQDGEPYRATYRLKTTGGEWLWFEARGATLRDAQGVSRRMAGSITDITERRRTEEELEASRALLELTGEMAQVGGWELDLRTMKQVWTLQTFRIVEAEPPIPPTLEEGINMYAPVAQPIIRAAVESAIQSGTPYDLELPAITRKGRPIWVRAQGSAVLVDGKAIKLVGSFQDITRRKLAEEALRESELRQRLALEGGDLGLWDWNVPTGEVTVNDRWCAMVGHGLEEIVPHLDSWRDRVHPDDLPGATLAWADYTGGRTPAYEAEYRLRHKDGGWVWVLDKGRVVERDDDGQPLRACGTHLDITQRKLAEEAQQQSEERFRQVTETIDQVFWMTSVDKRRMLYVSPGYERIWGRTCQSLYAEPLTWLDSVHPEDRPHLLAAATTQQAKGVYDVDYRIRRPDGTVRWIHDRAFPIRDAAGEVERIAGVAEDITRRKQTEEALRESQSILARAQELAHLGSYQFDVPLGKTSAWSAELFLILGFDPAGPEVSVAEYFERIIHPDDRRRVVKSLERAVRAGQRYDAGYRIVRPDGEIRHVQSVAEPALEADGQVRKFIGFLQDVTELRQLEARLLDISDHEQQRIGQDLHDDLCQQLVGIEFRLEALQHELPEPSPAHTELQRIGSLLRRAARHARTMAGALSPVPPDPHGLMDALQSLASHSALLFRIECEYQCETPVFVADHTVAAHLYRIAQEAISNAFRHGHATRVLVTLADSVGEGHLTMEDNGSGCPLPIPPGQGMGTRIMQYRAGMIGATLRLEPAASGGLTVTCSFPLRTP